MWDNKKKIYIKSNFFKFYIIFGGFGFKKE